MFHTKDVEILVFQIENNQVVGVESIELHNDRYENKIQFLKRLEINGVYLLEIEDECRRILQDNDNSVMTGEMLMDDKLFNSLYFSNINQQS